MKYYMDEVYKVADDHCIPVQTAIISGSNKYY